MRKIDLITGFLGAGKTTFLLKYAEFLMNRGEKIGILEYDYGALNADMLLLSPLRGERCELESVAAACDADCLNRRFRTKLISMAMSGYDRVIVEPSGIFDMDLFFDSLREEPLENWYEIDNVLTVVDAGLAEDLTGEEQFFLASQATCAGTILLSRTQLTSPERVERTKQLLQEAGREIRCRHFAPVYEEKNWQDLTGEDMERLSHSGYHLPDFMKTIAGRASDFSSVSFLNLEIGWEELQEEIRTLFASEEYGEILRIKGFLPENGAFRQINATKHAVSCEMVPQGQNALIVIGQKLNEPRIRAVIADRKS